MNKELIKNDKEINNIFLNIKDLVITSRNKVYSTINTEMLNLYWNIGRIILEIQEGGEKSHLWRICIRKIISKINNRIWARLFF